jgi:hypothetical protein
MKFAYSLNATELNSHENKSILHPTESIMKERLRENSFLEL